MTLNHRCMLKRNFASANPVVTGLQTPPETESEGGSSGRSDDGDESVLSRSEADTDLHQEESETFISQALEEVELD